MTENIATIEIIEAIAEGEATVADAPAKVKLVPTRTRINPVNVAEDAPVFEEGDIIHVVVNESGKHRAIITGPDHLMFVGNTIDTTRFGTLTVVGTRFSSGDVNGDVPDTNLPVRVFA